MCCTLLQYFEAVFQLVLGCLRLFLDVLGCAGPFSRLFMMFQVVLVCLVGLSWDD